jgi:hypothetical protein
MTRRHIIHIPATITFDDEVWIQINQHPLVEVVVDKDTNEDLQETDE